jgi:hypothetical protein
METPMRTLLRYCLLLLTGVISLSSCQKIEPASTIQSRAVVESYLTPLKPISVKVTNEATFSAGDSSKIINGLNVQVSVDGVSYPLIQDVDGVYKNALKVDSTKLYAVFFNYKDKIVSSSTTIPTKPQGYDIASEDPTLSDSVITIPQFNSAVGNFPLFPLPFILKWKNPDQSYYQVVVKNIEKNPDPINLGATDRPYTFSTLPMQASQYILRARTFQYYGRHWVILYKIKPEYAALYQSNGSTTYNLRTPYSNVTNGLGLFTGINADTLQVRVKK